MFLGVLRQFTDQHDCHSSRIALEGELTLVVIDISVLVDFVELEVISLCFVDSLDIGIDHRFTIFD